MVESVETAMKIVSQELTPNGIITEMTMTRDEIYERYGVPVAQMRGDPVLFAEVFMGARLYPFQRKVLNALRTKPRKGQRFTFAGISADSSTTRAG